MRLPRLERVRRCETRRVRGSVRAEVCGCIIDEERTAHLTLQRGDAEFVHLDLLAIELRAAHAVAHVCLPPHLPRPQIEHLHIPVVIPRQNTPAEHYIHRACPIRPPLSGAIDSEPCGLLNGPSTQTGSALVQC